MSNILQIAAEVSVDTLKAGMEASVEYVKTAAAGMSDNFRTLAAESEAATNQIGSGWVRAAAASVELSLAKDQVRAASRAAKGAQDDEGVSLAVLAAAQQRSAEAARVMADAQKQLQDSAHGGGEAFSHFGELLREFVEKPFATVGEVAKAGAMSFGAVGVAAAGVTGAFAAVAFEGLHLVGEFGEATRQAENLANRLGITTAQALQLSAEAKLVGVEVASLAAASFRLGAALESPTGEGKKAADALHQLGVQMFTAAGESRELGPVLLDTLEALSRITSGAEQAALAHTILGRASKEIIPLLKAHQDLKQIVHELGVGLDEEETEALMRADKAARQLGLTWEETKRTLAAKIAPIVVPVMMEITRQLKGGDEKANPKNPTVPDPYANELRATTEAMSRMTTEHQARIIEATSQAVAAMMAPIAETAELSAAFKRTFDASREGLEEKLKAIKEARSKLVAVLESGALGDPKTYKAKESEYEQLGAQQAQIEAQLKKHVDRTFQIGELEIDREREHQKALFELQRDRVEAELKLGQITADQKFILDQRIVDNEIAVMRTLMDRKVALAQNDPDKGTASTKLQGERLALDDAYALKTQRNAEGVLEAKKRMNDLEEKDLQKLMDDMEKIRERELEAAQKVANELNLERAKAHELELRGEADHQKAIAELQKVELQNQLILHEITKQRYDALLAALEASERTHQLKILNDELLSLDISAKNRLTSEQGVQNKIQALRDKAALEQAKVAQDSVRQLEATYSKIFDPMAKASEQNIMAILRGQETLRQGMAKIGLDILADWIQMMIRAELKHVEHAAIDLMIHQTTNTAKVASDATAAAQTTTITAASSLKQITHAAASAAAKAYDSMADIPIVGPALGAIAAAATFAAVEGFGAMVSAERGAVLPADSFAMLHANEMVLPAPISKGIQDMISAGGSAPKMLAPSNFQLPSVGGAGAPGRDGANGLNVGSQAPQPHVHVHFNMGGALDGPSVADFFDKNHGKIMRNIQRSVRDGWKPS
jgi:hypothetical protein